MVGVELSNRDLEAITKLFKLRWSADIRNWNERGVEGCLWVITCPDKQGNWITRTGSSLCDTIDTILKEIL